jgi:hypothetical protein
MSRNGIVDIDTPRKSRIKGIYEWNDAHNIPYFHSDVLGSTWCQKKQDRPSLDRIIKPLITDITTMRQCRKPGAGNLSFLPKKSTESIASFRTLDGKLESSLVSKWHMNVDLTFIPILSTPT